MRLVFVGSSIYAYMLERLIENSHDIVAIHSEKPEMEIFLSVPALCKLHYVQSAPTLRDLESYLQQSVDLVLVAGYDRLLPIHPSLRAINIHPSLLPNGRGAWPSVRILLGMRAAAGVTLHKLSNRFDEGDIISQHPVRIGLLDDQCSYSFRCCLVASSLLIQVLKRFEEHWSNATPQGNGSYWHRPTLEIFQISFDLPAREIVRRVRIFSGLCYTASKTGSFPIRTASAWHEDASSMPIGYVLHETKELLIARVADGYVAFTRRNHPEADHIVGNPQNAE